MEEHIVRAREEALRQAVNIAIKHADRQMMTPAAIVEMAKAFEDFLTRAPEVTA